MISTPGVVLRKEPAQPSASAWVRISGSSYAVMKMRDRRFLRDGGGSGTARRGLGPWRTALGYTPLVLLADRSPSQKEEAMAENAVAVFLKPVDYDEVVATVVDALRESGNAISGC